MVKFWNVNQATAYDLRMILNIMWMIIMCVYIPYAFHIFHMHANNIYISYACKVQNILYICMQDIFQTKLWYIATYLDMQIRYIIYENDQEMNCSSRRSIKWANCSTWPHVMIYDEVRHKPRYGFLTAGILAIYRMLCICTKMHGSCYYKNRRKCNIYIKDVC